MPSINVVSMNAVNVQAVFKKYKKSIKDIFPQNLNIRTYSKTEMADLVSILFDEEKASKLFQVCPVHLVRNVNPHDDKEYCIREGISPKVYFLVIESKLKDVDHYDAPDYNYLFSGSDHIDLSENVLYQFDASKMHAVMVDKLVTGYTFWFRK